MGWVDIGVNLSNKQFDSDREQVVERACQAGADWLVLTCADLSESESVLALARQYPDLCVSTAEVHPHDAKDFVEDDLDRLRSLLAEPQVVAVGECGLDYNRDFSPRPVQREVLEQQLALAAELAMPVFLHERDASEDMLDIMKRWRDRLPAAVIHCFTGSEQALRDYISLDLHIGITGWVCDERRGQATTQSHRAAKDPRIWH